ncbi:AraC-type DNA-binding protein [Robiginitalea myxolifaciens]|uniref:AraC-type DNA-binding protein n=1 Tax=Robiginitalea myxolifaciens TaxID=400055 RepID=A0A1I6G0H8_9FLAO|nr:AraC family transcriptional regulator [Robiginitalea myxolifaciens]SFR35672.1 AraC-type DNA-binding protein [Robiginitalea myxolifaciens]
MSTKETLKNVASGSLRMLPIEAEVYLLRGENEQQQPALLQREIETGYLQFHFGLKGRARLFYNNDSYILDLPEEQSLILYNPQHNLPLKMELSPGARVFSLVMSIRRFHSLFTNEADSIPFLKEEYKEKRYYQQHPIGAALSVVLSQLWNEHMHPSVRELYIRAKTYELLSLYFNRNADAQAEQCPFLVDEENLGKIRRAKEIIIQRMAEPPTLAELSQEIGLPLKKLKEGFRQIYGDSVYSYLFDYKMESARKMLESGKFNVNEVGLKIGYSTASHFISAFKKKYHTTPKKYLMALAQQGA